MLVINVKSRHRVGKRCLILRRTSIKKIKFLFDNCSSTYILKVGEYKTETYNYFGCTLVSIRLPKSAIVGFCDIQFEIK